MKSFRKLLSLFWVILLGSLFMASCEIDTTDDDKEQNTNKTGKIYIDETLYTQYQGHIGSANVYDNQISCYTELYKSGPEGGYNPYLLDLSFSHCVQGNEVKVENLELRYSDYSVDKFNLISGKIVCTKKTSTELELKFSNVNFSESGARIVKTESYAQGVHGVHYQYIPYTSSYQLDGTLKFEFR